MANAAARSACSTRPYGIWRETAWRAALAHPRPQRRCRRARHDRDLCERRHYRADNDIALLCDDVRRAIQRGHRRFKIKIGGATLRDDLRRTEALLAILQPA